MRRVLNKILHQGSLRKRYIVDARQGSEFSSGSESTRTLNMSGLHKVLKKSCSIDAWQDSEYSSSSEYGRILNMPGLHKVLNKTLHYKYLIGFWICPYFLNGRVTESFKFCVNCILEIHGILNVTLVLNIPRLWMYQES